MQLSSRGLWFDLIKGSVVTLALFLAYIAVPLFGMVPGILAPLPAMYYAMKGGGRLGAGIVVIAAAVLVPVAGPSTALLYLLQCGVISIVLQSALTRNWGGARAIASAVFVDLVILLPVAISLGSGEAGGLSGVIRKGIDSSIAQTVALYEKSGLGPDELKLLKEGMLQAGAFISRTYPALVIVSLILIAAVNLWCLVRLVRQRLGTALPVGEFATFRNPDYLVWLLIVAGFAMLAGVPAVNTVALNVLIVTLSLYAIQGLAIVSHFFARFTVPTAVRAIIYLILVLQPYLAVVVAALGIFDLWGNFRTPRKPENL